MHKEGAVGAHGAPGCRESYTWHAPACALVETGRCHRGNRRSRRAGQGPERSLAASGLGGAGGPRDGMLCLSQSTSLGEGRCTVPLCFNLHAPRGGNDTVRN